MSYIKNHEIKDTSTEINFYKAIISYITGLDSRITCEDDPDEEFDISTKGSSYKPTFTFKVGTREFFKIKRPKALSDDEWEIETEIILNNSSSVNNPEIYFKNNPQKAYDEDATRIIFVSSIITSNIIYIWIKSTNGAPSTKTSLLIFCVSGSNAYKAGSKNINSMFYDFSNLIFYDADEDGIVGKIMTRFSYSTAPGTLDYIKSSVFYDTDGSSSGDSRSKIFEILGIYDCTTVNIGDTVSLNDGLYVAVGANQLVKIS